MRHDGENWNKHIQPHCGVAAVSPQSIARDDHYIPFRQPETSRRRRQMSKIQVFGLSRKQSGDAERDPVIGDWAWAKRIELHQAAFLVLQSPIAPHSN